MPIVIRKGQNAIFFHNVHYNNAVSKRTVKIIIVIFVVNDLYGLFTVLVPKTKSTSEN